MRYLLHGEIRWTVTKYWQDAKELELSSKAGRNTKWHNHLGKQFVSFLKRKRDDPGISLLCIYPRGIKAVECPFKGLYVNVRSSICNHLKQETT